MKMFTKMFRLEERRLRGELVALFICLEGGCSQVGVSLFSQVIGDRTRGNSLKLHQDRFRFNIKKMSSTKRLVKHWNKVPKAVVGSPSLKALQRCDTWGHSVSDELGSDGLVVGLDNLRGLF